MAKCGVEGCEKSVHARGYCRRHYGQIWRHGRITGDGEGVAGKKMSARQRTEADQMRALERELHRAEMMYNNIIGVEGRLKWRREIALVKQEMARLGMPMPLAGDGKRTTGNAAV